MPLQQLLITLVRYAVDHTLTQRDFDRIVRRQLIIETLLHHGLNQCHAAKALGVHRNTLSRQLDELDINVRLMRRSAALPAMIASA